MNIIEKSIKRKISTAMFFSAVFVMGILALVRIPVELLPRISMPGLTVITPLPDALPGEIETLVTTRIEEAVSSVNGVSDMTSRSIEGLSIVKVRFNWGRDMDLALIETKEKADLAGGLLPEDTGKSIVVKYDPSDEPVMIYSFTGNGLPKGSLRRRAEKEIVPYIERIDGVALVDLSGGERREILVESDVSKLYSYNLSLIEVADSIAMANYNHPAGMLTDNDKEYLVRTAGEFGNPHDIKSVAVLYNDKGLPVHVSDIAVVKDTFRERKSRVRFNKKEGVALLIRKEPGKNTIKTCENIRTRMDELIKGIGKDITISCIYDQSSFISASIKSVLVSAILGGIIACLVLWFFLGSTVPPLIIGLSIPVSITGTFLLMYLFGVSINTMSLGGLALGVGMMVDAGIVVLESIGNISVGEKDSATLALEGTVEVMAPVAVSVFTSVIVFIPIIFLSGLSGALFRDLALTVSFALFFSLLTSLTLIPMLVSVFSVVTVKVKSKGMIFSLYMEEFYEKIIKFALKKRKAVLLVGIASFIVGILFFLLIDRRIMPQVDPGEFSINIELPGGTMLEDTSVLCRRIEDYILGLDCVENVYAKAGSDPDDNIWERISGRGSGDAVIRVFMKKGYSAEEGINYLKENLRFNKTVSIEYQIKKDVVSTILSGSEDIVKIEVSGGDRSLLARRSFELRENLRGISEIEKITLSCENTSPGLHVHIDRVRAASLGLDMENIASSISGALRGEIATVFRQGDDESDVLVRLRLEDREDRDSILKIPVKSSEGVLVPVGSFAEVREVPASPAIFRREQSAIEFVEVSYNRESKFNFRELESVLENTEGRGIILTALTGMEEVKKTFSSLSSAMVLALVFIYMLLASQFQSLKNPLVVMFSIPVAALGVSLSLFVTGESLNINSGIGIIMLCGIVVNNAIVLFDCIEKGISEKLSLSEVVISAGRRRLRPIIMTTLTTVLALLPMALGIGQGAELQRSLAVTVMGGMIFSTALTLIFMPIGYVMVNDFAGSAE